MTQLSLFSPIARNTDPVTSHLAAQEVTREGIRGKQALIVLEAVRRYPGRTSMELSRLCELDRYQISRRLADLEHAGEVEKGEARMCDIAGRLAVTWRAV